jgi:hypothetical protein
MIRLKAIVTVDLDMTYPEAKKWAEEHTIFDLIDRDADVEGPKIDEPVRRSSRWRVSSSRVMLFHS